MAGPLTFGLGHIPALLTLGLGSRTPQTMHPSEFNTPVIDPSQLAHDRYLNTEGCLEYGVINPTPNSVYNGRSIQIFTPHGLLLSPRSLTRLEAVVKALKPLTCAVRMVEVEGAEHFKLLDEYEDANV